MITLPRPRRKSDFALLLTFFILSALLLWLPTGYEKRIENRSIRCVGQVLETDNSEIQQFGLVKTGDQQVRIRMIWKILVPSLLKGYDPLILSLGGVAVLTAVIMFLVMVAPFTALIGGFVLVGKKAAQPGMPEVRLQSILS